MRKEHISTQQLESKPGHYKKIGSNTWSSSKSKSVKKDDMIQKGFEFALVGGKRFRDVDRGKQVTTFNHSFFK
jgi:hypothetical protein